MQIRIDGRILEAQPNQTVLEAAREHGFYIPSLCYHRKTGKAGRCRICVVEVEGMRGLQVSCNLPVREGMVVHTDTPTVLATRRMNRARVRYADPMAFQTWWSLSPDGGGRASPLRGRTQLHRLRAERLLRTPGRRIPPRHRGPLLPHPGRAQGGGRFERDGDS